jgi:dolichol-phosphate mannosyltransferase
LTSFSFTPIYVLVVLAAVGLVGAAGLLGTAFVLAARGSSAAFSTALLAVLTFFWATVVAAIAVVGLYVIRIYKDVRARPHYIVESTVGLPAARFDERMKVTRA